MKPPCRRSTLPGRFPLHARALIPLVALAGVLAGCQGGGTSPATSPATSAATSAAAEPPSGGAPSSADASSAAGPPTSTAAGAPSRTGTGCPEAIANNTYVRATSAHADGDAVVVTAHPALRVCGGPNNSHYKIEAGTKRLTVTTSATIVMLTATPSGLGHETVAPAEFPKRLVDDRFNGIFLVRGPGSAVTSLEEQYQP